jgi:hypothetical protein
MQTGDVSLFVVGGSSAFCNDMCVDVCIKGSVGCDIISCLNSCQLTLSGDNNNVSHDDAMEVDDDSNYYNNKYDMFMHGPSSTTAMPELRFYYIYAYFDFDTNYYSDDGDSDSDSDSDGGYDYSELDQYYADYFDQYYEDGYYYDENKVPSASDNSMILQATQLKITDMYNTLVEKLAQFQLLSTDDLQYGIVQLQVAIGTSELRAMIEGYDKMADAFGVDTQVSDWLDVSAIFPSTTTAAPTPI